MAAAVKRERAWGQMRKMGTAPTPGPLLGHAAITPCAQGQKPVCMGHRVHGPKAVCTGVSEKFSINLHRGRVLVGSKTILTPSLGENHAYLLKTRHNKNPTLLKVYMESTCIDRI